MINILVLTNRVEKWIDKMYQSINTPKCRIEKGRAIISNNTIRIIILKDVNINSHIARQNVVIVDKPELIDVEKIELNHLITHDIIYTTKYEGEKNT